MWVPLIDRHITGFLCESSENRRALGASSSTSRPRPVDRAERSGAVSAPLAVPGAAISYAALAWADAARSIPGAEDHELFPALLAPRRWGADRLSTLRARGASMPCTDVVAYIRNGTGGALDEA
jgi:hypothetical protein